MDSKVLICFIACLAVMYPDICGISDRKIQNGHPEVNGAVRAGKDCR